MTKLPNPPLDCISRVRFAPAEGNCQFLAASWDGTVRLYDAGTRRLLGQHKQPLPILDAVFFEDSLKCVAAGLSKKVMLSASDWCAMGVVEVELATGLLPPAVPSNDAARQLCDGLLEPQRTRLNADGVRSTALFLDFPWERLRADTLRAPVQTGQADPLANARGGVALAAGTPRVGSHWHEPFSAGAEDFCSHHDTCVGEHREAVKCLEYDSEHRQILSASWDKTLCAWDSRRPGEASASVKLGAKAFSMDAKGNKVIVGASDRCLHVFDLRKLSQRMEKLESLLKVQLRCVKIGPDEHHAAVGSDEGRVALEPLCRSRPPGDSVRYAFKCHRAKAEGKEVAHQVNAIAFHPAYATFATGGGDGSTCFWDGFARKRLAKLGPFSTAVSSLDFSADGALLAVAVSYAFEEGERCPPPVPSLFVRAVEPADVRPKEG